MISKPRRPFYSAKDDAYVVAEDTSKCGRCLVTLEDDGSLRINQEYNQIWLDSGEAKRLGLLLRAFSLESE